MQNGCLAINTARPNSRVHLSYRIGGMRKIEISFVQYLDNTAEKLDVPRIRYVHEDTDFGEGGYLTIEEFAEWLDWQ